MSNNAYEAYGENPLVLCSHGSTPGKAMKAMGKLIDKHIKKNEDTLVLSINSMYDDDGVFCMNATISSWN